MNGSINKIILIGNLGDDVKMHHFDNQNTLGRFPVATSESYLKKDTNERVTKTEWHTIVVRNRLAEICEKYIKKGDKVYIEGSLRNRKWDDNGTTRYTTEIYAESVEFLTPKNSNSTKDNDLPF
ncbi:single-stranded DNA-binding protein [Flavobacteriaceae bacterium UJ101]|nr:single-stranded DNA-binding protein [Flavobacteriaceae bacterium UJ101]